jgi:hypothetical protein
MREREGKKTQKNIPVLIDVGESRVVWDKKIKITPSVTSYIFLNI